MPQNEFERTMAFAEKAVALMRAHKTYAYPRMYELWYTYVGGQNPALSQAVNAVLTQHGTMYNTDAEAIYETHLSPSRFSAKVDDAGSRMLGQIDHVMEAVDKAADQAALYGDELKTVREKLGGEPSRDVQRFRAFGDSLARLARDMETTNKTLESQLIEARLEITDLQTDLSAARAESLTDPLTSLANRKAFDTALEISIKDALRSGEPMALLMTDIDHFKRFNDTYGHLTGDQVLRLVALGVKQNVKGSDLAARYGGEEFVVILPATPLRAAVTVADHIRRAVMAKELVKRSTGESLGRVTISIGIAIVQPGDTVSTLIDRADACLYAAKRAGRNRVISEADPEYAMPTAVA